MPLMAMGRTQQIRVGLLIIASWVVVAIVTGTSVYRITRMDAVTRPAEVESATESAVDDRMPKDPSAEAVREILAAKKPANPTETDKPNGTSESVTTGEMHVASSTTATLSPHERELQAAQARREREAKARAELRQKFAGMLDGTVAWSGLNSGVLNVLTADDIAAGLAQVDKMPWTPEANQLLQSLLRRWADLDPQAAANYALGLESNRAGSNAIRSIWDAWAAKDPAAAIDWYFANEEKFPAKLSGTLRSVFSQMAKMDMARALASAWQLPAAQERDAIQAIVRQASINGNLGALQSVVGGMTAGPQRDFMITTIMQEYAVYQPDQAVRWINLLDNAQARNGAVNQLVQVWGFDRPAEAAQWVATLPDPNLRGNSAATLLRSWAVSEPEAAGAWLMQLPAARPLDGALEQYVRTIQQDNPVSAMNFVTRVTDPRKQQQLAVMVGRTWMRLDPAQARAYFQQSNWPPNIRNQFQ